MDYVEHKILSTGMIEYIETMKDKIIIQRDIREMEKLVNTYNDRDLDFLSKYDTEDSIFVNSCFMFVFNDKFIEVYSVKPITLLKEVLLKKQSYPCNKCSKVMEFDNTSHESSVPDVMYRLTDKVEYFCKDCSKSIKGLKHAGEQIG
jgi:DNA-directed RNA polymerase subunit RPC12/RpoP